MRVTLEACYITERNSKEFLNRKTCQLNFEFEKALLKWQAKEEDEVTEVKSSPEASQIEGSRRKGKDYFQNALKTSVPCVGMISVFLPLAFVIIRSVMLVQPG